MPLVPLLTRPSGLVGRYAARYSVKRFGAVIDPLRAAAHHPGVVLAHGAEETVVERRWNRLDPGLRWLATMMVAQRIGCSWCIDYGWYDGVTRGLDPTRIRSVSQWRASNVYDERERLVLEYAEGATATPATLDDDLAERLRAAFTEAELVELAGWVALENQRSRFNAGLGLTSQGFRDRCAVPAGA